MNYKNTSLFILLNLAVFFAGAQTKQPGQVIASWKITYDLELTSSEPAKTPAAQNEQRRQLKQLTQSLSSATDNTPPLVGFVSKEYIRIEQTGIGGGITLADKRKTVSYLLDTVTHVATQYPLHKNTTQKKQTGDSLMVISSKNFVMKLLPDTMTIAGKLCKKATFTVPNKPKDLITVWYAPDMPRLYWEKYSYLKQLPGCTLAISTVSHGMNVGIQASMVEEMNVPEEFYLVPGTYKIGIQSVH